MLQIYEGSGMKSSTDGTAAARIPNTMIELLEKVQKAWTPLLEEKQFQSEENLKKFSAAQGKKDRESKELEKKSEYVKNANLILDYSMFELYGVCEKELKKYPVDTSVATLGSGIKTAMTNYNAPFFYMDSEACVPYLPCVSSESDKLYKKMQLLEYVFTKLYEMSEEMKYASKLIIQRALKGGIGGTYAGARLRLPETTKRLDAYAKTKKIKRLTITDVSVQGDITYSDGSVERAQPEQKLKTTTTVFSQSSSSLDEKYSDQKHSPSSHTASQERKLSSNTLQTISAEKKDEYKYDESEFESEDDKDVFYDAEPEFKHEPQDTEEVSGDFLENFRSQVNKELQKEKNDEPTQAKIMQLSEQLALLSFTVETCGLDLEMFPKELYEVMCVFANVPDWWETHPCMEDKLEEQDGSNFNVILKKLIELRYINNVTLDGMKSEFEEVIGYYHSNMRTFLINESTEKLTLDFRLLQFMRSSINTGLSNNIEKIDDKNKIVKLFDHIETISTQVSPEDISLLNDALRLVARGIQNPSAVTQKEFRTIANQLQGKPSLSMQIAGVLLMSVAVVLAAVAIAGLVAASIATGGVTAPATCVLGMKIALPVSAAVAYAGYRMFKSGQRSGLSHELNEVRKVIRNEQ